MSTAVDWAVLCTYYILYLESLTAGLGKDVLKSWYIVQCTQFVVVRRKFGQVERRTASTQLESQLRRPTPLSTRVIYSHLLTHRRPLMRT